MQFWSKASHNLIKNKTKAWTNVQLWSESPKASQIDNLSLYLTAFRSSFVLDFWNILAWYHFYGLWTNKYLACSSFYQTIQIWNVDLFTFHFIRILQLLLITWKMHLSTFSLPTVVSISFVAISFHISRSGLSELIIFIIDHLLFINLIRN